MRQQILSDWVRRSGLARRLPEGGLVHWWLGCLLGCLPNAWRKRLAVEAIPVVVEPAGGSALVRVEEGEAAREVGTFLTGDGEIARALIRGAGLRRARVVLCLPSREVLRRKLSFPLGVEENLRQVLGFEMDRVTPFSSEEVYYDFRVVERNAQHNKLLVEVAVTPRRGVDTWLADLAGPGTGPTVVDAEGLWPGLNLLPPEQRRLDQQRFRPLDGVVFLALVLSLTAVLVVPLWQKRQIAIDLERQVQKVRPVAEEVAGLREKLEKAERSSRYLVERREQQMFVIDILTEVTRRVPDDTWVQQLEYRDGEVQLRGESGDAAGLIKRFNESALFRGVGFRSPVVQQPRTGKERFHLAAQASGRVAQ